MADKAKVKGLSGDDLNKMFDVTAEKRENMKSFDGKDKLKMPEPGDKKGIIVRLLWSKDADGNPAFVREIEHEKLVSADKKMKLLTVEEQGNEGIECEIPYGASLHYSLVKIADSKGLKLEDLIGKWFKITADTFKSDKAASGEAKGYRATWREDLNNAVPGGKSAAANF